MFTVSSKTRNSRLFLIGALAIVLITLALTACIAGVTATQVELPPTIEPTPTIQPTPTYVVQPTPTYVINHVPQLQGIEIQMISSDPLQVNAIVRGNLMESCATLGEIQVQYVANTFQIAVYAVNSGAQSCVAVITPFETTIPLSTSGLPPGTYSVVVNNSIGAVFTVPVANAPSALLSVQPNPQSCVDAAKFVADVSVPDNSLIAPNAPFVKIWRLKNTGTCTWDDSYLVSHISGPGMSQDSAYYIVERGQRVAPGQTVDISVGMTSPVESGIYQSYWGLKKEHGQLIPIQGGAKGNSFYVKIKVNNPPPGGQVTGASIGIGSYGKEAGCTPDAIYYVEAYINADGPTSADYEISALAGNFQNLTGGVLGYSVTGTLVFDQAGTKDMAWMLVGPYYPYHDDIVVYLRVNGREFHNAKVSCQQ